MICGYVAKGAAPPAVCPSCGAPFTAFERRQKSPEDRLRGTPIAEPRPAGTRFVIIGNSAAGRSAARAIQAVSPGAAVTVLSAEPVAFYCRPLLPDLIGGMELDQFLSAGSLYPETGLDLRLGVEVTGLDTDARQLTLADGSTVGYDYLLLATGSAPVVVPWPGADVEGIAYFRTYADALRIAGDMATARRAVVVGGGLLGLEFVRAFVARGLAVTLLVREDHVGFPGVDRRGAPLLEAALRDLGVEVALEEEVAEFVSASGRVSGVKTSRDRLLECDLVGVAVGARPRVELAREAGIAVDRGILVDRAFATSDPGVYAAGDCAQAWDLLRGVQRVNTSWLLAREQGELAGLAMAGAEVEYPGAVAVNYQLAAGLPFCSMGNANPENEDGLTVQVDLDLEGRRFSKVVSDSEAPVGASLIGDLTPAAGLETAMRARTPSESAATPAVPPASDAAPTAQPSSAAPELTTSSPPTERSSTMRKMTEANVKDAFAGESQAHMKYAAFAKRAEEEGKPNISRLFQATSYSEKVHATQHLRVLEGVGETAQNLQEAIEGEGFEIAEMYPAYIAVAMEQDESEAQQSLNAALQAEKVHHTLYEKAQAAVGIGKDLDLEDLWVCSECGYTMVGEAPDRCPICTAPKKYFVSF